MTERTRPGDWERRKAGLACPGCADGRLDEDEHGVRYFSIDHADAHLQRVTLEPGYSVVVFVAATSLAPPWDEDQPWELTAGPGFAARRPPRPTGRLLRL